jgi:hypothetical protein
VASDETVKVIVEFSTFDEASEFVKTLQSQPDLLEGALRVNIGFEPTRRNPVTERCVFISYRRADSADIALHIYNELVKELGRENVFIDVQNIALGADFRRVLNQKLDGCEVILVLIGPRWDDETHLARLHDPEDFVRIEVETGLARDIRVVPLLVLQRAKMPDAAKLPVGLRALVDRNGMQIRPGRDFPTDMQRLIEDIIKPPL